MNIIRFPTERTRLPGESRESHTNRLQRYDSIEDTIDAEDSWELFKKSLGMDEVKAQTVIAEIADVLEEFEEFEEMESDQPA
jgi:ERCC4-type nuclease